MGKKLLKLCVALAFMAGLAGISWAALIVNVPQSVSILLLGCGLIGCAMIGKKTLGISGEE